MPLAYILTSTIVKIFRPISSQKKTALWFVTTWKVSNCKHSQEEISNWIYLGEEIELGSNNDFLQDTFMHLQAKINSNVNIYKLLFLQNTVNFSPIAMHAGKYS